MERTFCMIKPDALQRRLAGRIIGRIEEKGLRIAGLKLVRVTPRQAEELYSVHRGKPFYEPLVRFVTSSPVVVMVIEGFQAVPVMRRLLGATAAADAEPGTIRGDFGLSNRHNLVHGSDSVESARREAAVFFMESELVSYEQADDSWVTADMEKK